MTTVHHPPLKGIDFRHDHQWLWAGLLSALVVIVVMAVAWGLTNANLTDDTFVASVEGVELIEEATVGHVQSPGVTAQYFGNSGELYPVPVSAFELDHETTAGYHVQRPGVTAQYFGNSGELYPEK
jgi:hypothetical protein